VIGRDMKKGVVEDELKKLAEKVFREEKSILN
jgi:hypothetical protein